MTTPLDHAFQAIDAANAATLSLKLQQLAGGAIYNEDGTAVIVVHDQKLKALAELVEEKAQLIARWSSEGRIAVVHPKHLIFSIWATTQHYADFDVQVRAVLGPHESDPFPSAEAHLDLLFRKLLQP